MKRLTEYLNSSFVEAANSLRPKRAAQRIIAYVESYDDISFWRSVFNEYESDKVHFELMLPARTKLTKGKKQAMMNMLGKAYGKNMIACVDSDYDYLLQGATSTSRQMLENKYILHTYAYESGRGIGSLLMKEAVRWAKNNHYPINPICSFAKKYLEHNSYT
jgi:predicted GNAT family acetyltransferase